MGSTPKYSHRLEIRRALHLQPSDNKEVAAKEELTQQKKIKKKLKQIINKIN